MKALDQRLRNMRLGIPKFEVGIRRDETKHMIEEDDREQDARHPRAFAGIEVSGSNSVIGTLRTPGKQLSRGKAGRG